VKIKGKTVTDSKTPLVLKITKKDISGGKTKMPDACAAAVCAMRECKGAVSAHIHLSRAYVEYPKKIVRYTVPAALRTEIVSFDRGHSFTSGEYTLLPVAPSNRLGKDKRGFTASGPRLTRKRPPHFLSGVRAHAPKKSDWT